MKCLCTAPEAAVPPLSRLRPPVIRTLDMLNDDLQRFTDAGADVDAAKRFNNVIGPAFFDVPLDQVIHLLCYFSFSFTVVHPSLVELNWMMA